MSCWSNSSVITVSNFTFQGIYPEEVDLWSMSHILLVLLLCGCQVVHIGGKCGSILYISRHMPKGRPINALMLKDQVIQLVAFGILNSLVISSVATNEPIEKLFGYGSCWVQWISLIGACSLYFGGCFQALFRLIYTEKPHWVSDPWKTKMYANGFMAAEGGLTSVIVLNALREWFTYRQSTQFEFCRGWGHEISMMEAHSLGIFGEGFHSDINNSVAFIVTTIEVSSYLRLYRSLQKKQSQNTALTQEMKQWKQRRNALTLGGQTFCFVTELIFAIVYRLVHFIPVIAGLHKSFVMALGFVFLSAVTTVSYYVASPELRRHYFKSYY